MIKYITLTCSYCGNTFQRRWKSRPEARGYVNAFCNRDCINAHLSENPVRPRKPIPHGTEGGYNHYRCRCEMCREAHRYYMAKRRAHTKGQPSTEGQPLMEKLLEILKD